MPPPFLSASEVDTAVHESAPQPQSRRALRELERASAARRGRGRGSLSRRAHGHRAAPHPAVTPDTPKQHRPLAAAAFICAIGLAATSIVPMLALGQTATAAAATAVGAQAPAKVQAWRSSMLAQLPSLAREDYTVGTGQPSGIFAGATHADTFTNNVTWAIQWPFPFGVPIASPFGPRAAPTEGASTFHEGVDFDPGAGTPIQIITKGVVEKVVTNPSDPLGVHVIVDHGMIGGHHIESYYCEMAPGSVQVTEGQQVKVGDIVGKVGISGITTGAHLHFELHVDGTPVDPVAWLKANAG